MIRIVFIGAMLVMLALVLYIPSTRPPEHFMSLIRVEHERNVAVWGEHGAVDIVARMLDLQASGVDLKTASGAVMEGGKPQDPLLSAVGSPLDNVQKSLFGAGYFRSIDAALALATFRIAGALQFLPVALLFAAAALLDGLMSRVVRSKEFGMFSPEMFALTTCAFIITGCAMVVSTLLPVAMSPLWFGIGLVMLGVFVSRAVANFHRRA